MSPPLQLYPQHLASIDPYSNIKALEIYTTIRNTKVIGPTP